MLTDGPASGYDLQKHFESTFAHFFAAGYGSIYPALSALSKQGFVSCEKIPQEGKPDRKVYEITEEGRQFLLKALENPGYILKKTLYAGGSLCFAHLMQQEDIETVLDNRLEDIARYQEMFRLIEGDSTSDWPGGTKFVLGFGKALATAMETYISENRHLLAEPPVAKTATG